MVEYKTLPKQFVECGDEDQSLGRIRGVNDIKALPRTNYQREQEHRHSGVGVFPKITQESVCFKRRRKAVNPDAID